MSRGTVPKQRKFKEILSCRHARLYSTRLALSITSQSKRAVPSSTNANASERETVVISPTDEVAHVLDDVFYMKQGVTTESGTVTEPAPHSVSAYMHLAQTCVNFIRANFNCTVLVLRETTSEGPRAVHPLPELDEWIGYILWRTRLPECVAYAALLLLLRLKLKNPLYYMSATIHPHGLFLPAYMVAAKVMWDFSYNNKAWSSTTQGLLDVRIVNELEMELCKSLGWILQVNGELLEIFTERVKEDLAGERPYPPTYGIEYGLFLSASDTPPTPQEHVPVCTESKPSVSLSHVFCCYDPDSSHPPHQTWIPCPEPSVTMLNQTNPTSMESMFAIHLC